MGNNLQAQLDDGSTVIFNLGDMSWIIAATALVWIMIPGLGFFYSGLLRRKNAASMLYVSMIVLATVSFQVSCPYASLLRSIPVGHGLTRPSCF